MITAISSIRHNVNVGNNIKKTNSIGFTGNPVSLLKSETKISRFADEAASSIGSFLSKKLGKVELPFSEKPLIADATLVHFGPDGMPIEIALPQVQSAVTKILDGSNMLTPDAADIAANAANALTAKAGALDTLAAGADALTAKADVVDTLATGTDALAAKSDAATVIGTIAEALGHIV